MAPKKSKQPQGDGSPTISTTTIEEDAPTPTSVSVLPQLSQSKLQVPYTAPSTNTTPTIPSTNTGHMLSTTPTPRVPPATRSTRALSTASLPTASPSTRSTRTTPTHERTVSIDSTTDYESPLKKLKKMMSNHTRRVIDSVEDLRYFITHNDVANPEIRGSVKIQARLLWTKNETIRGLRFLRLYLGEEREPEPLHEQQEIYQKAQLDDVYEANQFLITLSLFDIAADHESLPKPGDIISFVPTKLRLYRDCCQVETRLQHIVQVK